MDTGFFGAAPVTHISHCAASLQFAFTYILSRTLSEAMIIKVSRRSICVEEPIVYHVLLRTISQHEPEDRISAALPCFIPVQLSDCDHGASLSYDSLCPFVLTVDMIKHLCFR